MGSQGVCLKVAINPLLLHDQGHYHYKIKNLKNISISYPLYFSSSIISLPEHDLNSKKIQAKIYHSVFGQPGPFTVEYIHSPYPLLSYSIIHIHSPCPPVANHDPSGWMSIAKMDLPKWDNQLFRNILLQLELGIEWELSW